tara:strand:- start:463 stop:1020 length:558 start_codon:yes stop_codon:yes gene_type:complete
MRIISGKFKGKKILQPKNKFTRPLKDLTKESIFNIINHSNLIKIKIEKSRILDLFSGVGSFGLECLSHGALSVTFCENYPDALSILKKNITNIASEKKTKIIEKDLFVDENLNFLKGSFEIIFLDPPYKEKRLNNLLEKIISLNLLSKNGIFIIHRHKKVRDKFTKKFNIFKEKNYGVSKIIFGN